MTKVEGLGPPKLDPLHTLSKKCHFFIFSFFAQNWLKMVLAPPKVPERREEFNLINENTRTMPNRAKHNEKLKKYAFWQFLTKIYFDGTKMTRQMSGFQKKITKNEQQYEFWQILTKIDFDGTKMIRKTSGIQNNWWKSQKYSKINQKSF